MKSLLYGFLITGLFVVSLLAHSREYHGVQFPDNVTLEGSDVSLQLNGIGMRTKFVFDIYIGALYTENPATTTEEVLNQKGPNRVLMHFLYDEVSAEKLRSAWTEGFEENQSEQVLKDLEQRIVKFNSMFSTVKESDLVLIDYVPGQGTSVTINGQLKGTVEGEEFNKALLEIWLGENPADDVLKEAMLGLTVE